MNSDTSRIEGERSSAADALNAPTVEALNSSALFTLRGINREFGPPICSSASAYIVNAGYTLG